MNLPAYSSLTAFIAHLQVLRMAQPVTTREQSAWLAEMESIIGELTPGERASLQNGEASGENARHRQRAERHLTHLLRSRGVLSG
jgi:hypothetical protein